MANNNSLGLVFIVAILSDPTPKEIDYNQGDVGTFLGNTFLNWLLKMLGYSTHFRHVVTYRPHQNTEPDLIEQVI